MQPIVLHTNLGENLVGIPWTDENPLNHYPYQYPPRYFYNRLYAEGWVVPILDRNYRIHFDIQYNDGGTPKAISVSFQETLDTLTPCDTQERNQHAPVRFFGLPDFTQNAVKPTTTDFFHLITIENDWGDSGNVNVMVSLNENHEPNQIFMEANCC